MNYRCDVTGTTVEIVSVRPDGSRGAPVLNLPFDKAVDLSRQLAAAVATAQAARRQQIERELKELEAKREDLLREAGELAAQPAADAEEKP